MANIRLLPSGNWNAQVRVKDKSPQSKTFSSKAAAESWASQIEAVTMDHKHHTIYTLGMTYCETMLKGKGSYQHALKVVVNRPGFTHMHSQMLISVRYQLLQENKQ